MQGSMAYYSYYSKCKKQHTFRVHIGSTSKYILKIGHICRTKVPSSSEKVTGLLYLYVIYFFNLANNYSCEAIMDMQ